MAKQSSIQRPLSPHLSIYKVQMSSGLSMIHRLSGIFLFFASSVIVWWMILSEFNLMCSCLDDMKNGEIAKIFWISFSAAGFYHLCAGIRHLIWDTGRCMSVESMENTGRITVICSVVLTILFWVAIV
jgi:succinate dehydrogenase / fumarate reductase cytochrome b subunit